MSQDRRIEVEEVNGVAIVTFLDKRLLDEAIIQVVGSQLVSLVDDDHKQKILLDFRGTEYLSSAFYAQLITLDKKQGDAGGTLVMCSIPSDMLVVFQITRLDKLFTIKENREKALENF